MLVDAGDRGSVGVPLEFCVGLTGVAAALGIGADLRSDMRSSARIPQASET